MVANRLNPRDITFLAGRLGLAGVLVALPIAFSPDMQRGTDIGKLMVLFPLMWIAFIGGAANFRLLNSESDDAGGRAYVGAKLALAVFAVAVLTSSSGASDTWQAVMGMHLRNEGMLVWICYIGTFFCGLLYMRNGRTLETLIDILLVASVAPIVYALLEGLGLNVYFNSHAIAARPGGSLGNPVYLAAYLGLLLPIGYARAWQVWHANRRLALMLSAVVILQGTMLVWTLSRGPLLAGLVVAGTFGTVVAARMGSSRMYAFGGMALLAVMTMLLAVNLHPQLRDMALETRLLVRMVLTMDPAIGGDKALGSLSAAIRVAYWHAGIQIFLEGEALKQLIGFGPDSAWQALYPHLSPLLMQSGGFREELVVDRVASDTLELLLAFGVVGWLAYVAFYSLIIYRGTCGIFGLRGVRPALGFAATAMASGAFAAMAAYAAGLGAALIPAFGMGMGLGWCLFIAALSARSVWSGAKLPGSGRQTLLLGCTSALIAFWLDAQVSTPVPTTRTLMFFICACVALLGTTKFLHPEGALEPRGGTPSDADTEFPANQTMSAITIGLIAAIASFFPLSGGSGYWPERIGLRVLPIAAFAFIAIGLLFWGQGARTKPIFQSAKAKLKAALLASTVLLFLICQRFFVVDISSLETVGDLLAQVAWGNLLVSAFFVTICVATAASDVRGGAVMRPADKFLNSRRGGGGSIAIGVLLAGLVCIFGGLWRFVSADVAAYAAAWQPLASKPVLKAKFGIEALRLLPQEAVYVTNSYRAMLAEVERQLSGNASQLEGAARSVSSVEPVLRAAVSRFPHDPWLRRDLAKWAVYKGVVDGLKGDKQAAAIAFEEARQNFALAHQKFPVQPLILQDWAWFEFISGRIPEAVQILDRMEALIPSDPEPYQVRAEMAARLRDSPQIESVREHARAALTPEKFKLFELHVAKLQQSRLK